MDKCRGTSYKARKCIRKLVVLKYYGSRFFQRYRRNKRKWPFFWRMVEGAGYLHWHLRFYYSHRRRIHILNDSHDSLLPNVHDLVYPSSQSYVWIDHPCTATFLWSKSRRYESYFFLKLNSVLHINYSFQHLGRILNRFAKDIGCMDEMLPSAFFDVITVNNFAVLNERHILIIVGFFVLFSMS